jgi:hypothetical protein
MKMRRGGFLAARRGEASPRGISGFGLLRAHVGLPAAIAAPTQARIIQGAFGIIRVRQSVQSVVKKAPRKFGCGCAAPGGFQQV